jgi:cytochrome c-type biogenesis protein
MTGISALALLTSFAAGAISFLSPCVLPLVPGYVSYVAGQSLQAQVASRFDRLRSLRLGLFFVAGFSTVFIAFGASATALGQLLLAHREAENLIGGVVVIAFGLSMVGLAALPWMQRDFRFHPDLPGGGALRAYALGLAFAFGWTPCIGPVLGTILTASAVSATVVQGIAMLAVYSAGLAVPFLAATLVTERLTGRLRAFGRIGRSLQIGAGALVIALGVAMVTDRLSAFSYWLLDTFPALAKIG